MKSIPYLFVLAVLLMSCKDKDDSKGSINANSLIGKWWTVNCIAVDQSSGNMTVVGGLDYGKFRFSADGSWTRQADEAILAICNPADSLHTFILNSGSGTGGYGIPFGDFNNPSDSSWRVSGTTIIINNWGNWHVSKQEESEIIFTSSRTNYLYQYTLIAE